MKGGHKKLLESLAKASVASIQALCRDHDTPDAYIEEAMRACASQGVARIMDTMRENYKDDGPVGDLMASIIASLYVKSFAKHFPDGNAIFAHFRGEVHRMLQILTEDEEVKLQ